MSKRPWMGSIFVVAAAINMTAVAFAGGPVDEGTYDRCRAIADDKARLHCFENLTSPQPQAAPSAPQVSAPQVSGPQVSGPQSVPSGSAEFPDIPQDSTRPHDSIFGSQTGPSSVPIAGKWRLVRTPNPREGHDVVSIMATAELSGSDIDFAGLNLRCVGQDFEILVFLIRPLRPRARPAISMNGQTFQGSVVSPGTAILLSKDASVFAKEQWQSLPNLSVDIEGDDTKTHGLVSLKGFDTALQTLLVSCMTR
jgi:hypothetical protein